MAKRYTGYNSQGMMNLVNNIIRAREFNQKMGLQQDSLNLEKEKALVDQQYKADTLQATKDWRTEQGEWRQDDKIRAETIRTEDLNRDSERYIAEQLRLGKSAEATASHRAKVLEATEDAKKMATERYIAEQERLKKVSGDTAEYRTKALDIEKAKVEKVLSKEDVLKLQGKFALKAEKDQQDEVTKDFPTKSASQFKESIYSGETGVFGRINIDPDQVLGAFLDQSTGGGKELNSLMKYAVNPRNKTTTNRDKATAVLKDGLMTMLKDADFYNSAKKREKLDQAVGQIRTYIDQLKSAGANTGELTKLLGSVLAMQKSYPKPKVKSEYNPRQGFGQGTY